MKKFVFCLVVSFSLVLVSTSSFAEILGCYQKEHGQLRVVSDHIECLSSEEPIIISQNDPIPFKTEQFCYNLYVIDDGTEIGPFPVNLELMLIGNQYHVQGDVTHFLDGSTSYISGSGALVNGEIIITFHSSHDHPQVNYRDGGTGQMIINADKSAGTFWDTRVDHNLATGESGNAYSEGRFEQTVCP